MIVSLQEVKDTLCLSGTDYDTQITALLPSCIDQSFYYTQNFFHHLPQKIGYNISFDAATKTITNGASDFLTVYTPNNGLPMLPQYAGQMIDEDLENFSVRLAFQAGMYIHIENSIFNDGYYQVNTVTATTIVLSSDDTLFNEPTGALITITNMVIRKGFKNGVAQVVNFFLDKHYGIKSSNTGGMSAQYETLDEVLSHSFPGYKRIKG